MMQTLLLHHSNFVEIHIVTHYNVNCNTNCGITHPMDTGYGVSMTANKYRSQYHMHYVEGFIKNNLGTEVGFLIAQREYNYVIL